MRELSITYYEKFSSVYDLKKKKNPDMLFSELTISYLDITFSIETLAVTYSKKFCFFRGIN